MPRNIVKRNDSTINKRIASNVKNAKSRTTMSRRKFNKIKRRMRRR